MQYFICVGMHKQTLPKFTMTQRVYFHASTKCTFNPDTIWDQKRNFMDPAWELKDVPRILKINFLHLNRHQM